MRIEKLRKHAELNLCKECFEKYKAVIEPSIRQLVANPLAGWPETEVLLTAIIWKDKGAYNYGTTMRAHYFRAVRKARLVKPAYQVETPPLKGNLANLKPAKKRIIYELVPPPKGPEERKVWAEKWQNPQAAAWGDRRLKRRSRGRPRTSKTREFFENVWRSCDGDVH